MSNRRKLRSRNLEEILPERLVNMCVEMDDDMFDNWLIFVTKKRARRGSRLAHEMLQRAGLSLAEGVATDAVQAEAS